MAATNRLSNEPQQLADDEKHSRWHCSQLTGLPTVCRLNQTSDVAGAEFIADDFVVGVLVAGYLTFECCLCLILGIYLTCVDVYFPLNCNVLL